MKKRESSAHSHDDPSKPDTSMVDIIVRITQNEMFGEYNAEIIAWPYETKFLSFSKSQSFELRFDFVFGIFDENPAVCVCTWRWICIEAHHTQSSSYDHGVEKYAFNFSYVFRWISSNESISEVVTESTDVPAAPSKQMTVLLRVDQPDIILVEKLDDINCLALILNVNLD